MTTTFDPRDVAAVYGVPVTELETALASGKLEGLAWDGSDFVLADAYDHRAAALVELQAERELAEAVEQGHLADVEEVARAAEEQARTRTLGELTEEEIEILAAAAEQDVALAFALREEFPDASLDDLLEAPSELDEAVAHMEARAAEEQAAKDLELDNEEQAGRAERAKDEADTKMVASQVSEVFDRDPAYVTFAQAWAAEQVRQNRRSSVGLRR